MSGVVFLLMIILCQNLFVLCWTPNINQPWIVFLLAIGFAFNQSIANGQVRALYGVYFPKNLASFNAATLFQTFGLFAGSLISTFFCVYIKSYVYVFLIVASLVSYTILSVRHISKQRRVKILIHKATMTEKNNEDITSAFTNLEEEEDYVSSENLESYQIHHEIEIRL